MNAPVTYGQTEFAPNSEASVRIRDARAMAVAVTTTRYGPSTRANIAVRASAWCGVLIGISDPPAGPRDRDRSPERAVPGPEYTSKPCGSTNTAPLVAPPPRTDDVTVAAKRGEAGDNGHHDACHSAVGQAGRHDRAWTPAVQRRTATCGIGRQRHHPDRRVLRPQSRPLPRHRAAALAACGQRAREKTTHPDL